MKNEQLIDDQDHSPKRKLTSIQLLIVVWILIGLIVFFSVLKSITSFVDPDPLVVLLCLITMNVSCAGFIFGLTERKLGQKRVAIGIWLNLLIFLIFLTLNSIKFYRVIQHFWTHFD